ncbi:unannotated protein [freshwater metagenome]|uniref:Unannotated protein n=1 Tax=freshwater metagenome TaxID=449393 RepID=A0A6J7INX8_9ZZZZ
MRVRVAVAEDVAQADPVAHRVVVAGADDRAVLDRDDLRAGAGRDLRGAVVAGTAAPDRGVRGGRRGALGHGRGTARVRVGDGALDGQGALGEAGQRRDERLGQPADEPGPQHHGVDVPVGVVVGEDRLADAVLRAGGLQVPGGGEDRVDRVHRVGLAVAVGVGAVRLPGGGHELHPALRAGGRDVEVAPVVRLDLVDRREDLPADAVLDAGGLVDRQEERRDPEPRDEEVRDRGGRAQQLGVAAQERRVRGLAGGAARDVGVGAVRRVLGVLAARLALVLRPLAGLLRGLLAGRGTATRRGGVPAGEGLARLAALPGALRPGGLGAPGAAAVVAEGVVLAHRVGVVGRRGGVRRRRRGRRDRGVGGGRRRGQGGGIDRVRRRRRVRGRGGRTGRGGRPRGRGGRGVGARGDEEAGGDDGRRTGAAARAGRAVGPPGVDGRRGPSLGAILAGSGHRGSSETVGAGASAPTRGNSVEKPGKAP